MVQFPNWCYVQDANVGAHSLRLISADPARLNIGINEIASTIPGHYAAEEQISRIMMRLGRPQAANFILGKLPTTKAIRSGDLGEILATEYIANHTAYQIPISRLRWKDHRNMAMRGDDVIGLQIEPVTGQLHFLKTEAKSRVALGAGVISDARAALDKDNGLPSAHALSFISSRLFEAGNMALADAIDQAQLQQGVDVHHVRHMVFTLSANAPDALHAASLGGYGGPIVQTNVGLRIETHADFVAAVYDMVIADANNN